jgi:uroporphyrin-3 C-methyltransferase
LLRNQGDWSLAEVEQIVNIAAQQLQLAGNVKAAIVALEVGDARLARMSDPQLAGLRMVLQQDLERLKAVPLVDSQGISLRLERMSAQVDTLPLAYLARPVAAGATASAAAASAAAPTSGWRRAWAEFKDLVRVQHMEQPAPALLSPEHDYFLRENLKLRLQGARFAVASRDNAAFQADLRAAKEWVQRYFDHSASPTRTALETIDTLLANSLVVTVPDIQTSLTAIHDLRLTREKGSPQ